MPAKGINDAGATDKLIKAAEFAAVHKPVNMGDMTTGTLLSVGKEEVLEGKNKSITHAVFTDCDTMKKYLQDLKDANLGLSVVVSGPLQYVFQCAKEVGLKPHTVQFSLGTFGNLDLLPPEEILEVSTMCGHALVSSMLVKKLAIDVNAGKITAEQAGRELGKQCVCGVFNPARAAELIKILAKKY
jgi:hypothetical protein